MKMNITPRGSRRLLRGLKHVLPALTLLALPMLSACGFGPDEPAEQVVVPDTPTPEPTQAFTPTPTVSPNLDGTTYTSTDKSLSIRLPDESWNIKMDEWQMQSFESPDQGSILILHGEGEDDMSSAIIPDTLDLAVSFEKASELEEGTDFEILNYDSAMAGEVGLYDYTVHYLTPEKSDGSLYTVNRYFVTDQEYYSLTGTVKKEEALSAIRHSIESFKVLDDSPIAAVALGNDDAPDPAQGGENVSQETQTDGSGGEAATASGQTSSEYTQDQLSSTEQTRTIYRNSDGAPIVVTPDGNGNWTDKNGNTYRYANDQDVYDQNDVDYYWHGEAGDVAFMPKADSGE